MIVRSADVKAKNPNRNVTVVPDGVTANTITITFDGFTESVAADQSTAQEIADLIKGILGDLFGILGDALSLVLSPALFVTSALKGQPPPQLNDVADKSADIANQILKFTAQTSHKTVSFDVPVIELNPESKCSKGYSVYATGFGTTTRGDGPLESATIDLAIGWIGQLEKQGGVRGRAGADLQFSAIAQLTGQSGALAHADPAFDVTMSATTDGDPNKKRHSEVQLTKVVFTLNSDQGC
jgi:hypothetical protein